MPHSPLPGFKALSIGAIGTGKTHTLRTLIEAGITPMCIFTENSFDVLGDTDPKKLHWMYVPPQTADLQNLIEVATRLANMNADAIQKTHDMSRSQRNQYIPFLNAMANFKCQRTGEVFGNVGKWGTDKCLVVDSMSGLTIAATKLAVGEKYALTQPEYQLVQKTIENLVNQLCSFWCHVVLTAHPERELDEVNGGVKIYPSTAGRKLAPLVGRNFTDVFMTKWDGTKYVWDTQDPQADLKSRNMPKGILTPGYGQIVTAWQKRGGIITPEVGPPPLPAIPA